MAGRDISDVTLATASESDSMGDAAEAALYCLEEAYSNVCRSHVLRLVPLTTATQVGCERREEGSHQPGMGRGRSTLEGEGSQTPNGSKGTQDEQEDLILNSTLLPMTTLLLCARHIVVAVRGVARQLKMLRPQPAGAIHLDGLNESMSNLFGTIAYAQHPHLATVRSSCPSSLPQERASFGAGAAAGGDNSSSGCARDEGVQEMRRASEVAGTGVCRHCVAAGRDRDAEREMQTHEERTRDNQSSDSIV